MRITWLLIISFIFSLYNTTLGQGSACGTIPTIKDLRARNSLQIVPFEAANRALSDEPIKVAVTAHIVRTDNGEGGLLERDLFEAIEKANSVFEVINMEFFLFGDINYINDSDYYDFESSQEAELASQHFVENSINIYFFNSAKTSESTVCGYTYFPGTGIDRIIMVNSCTRNGSTLSHELGHFFALFHTHGKTNFGTTDELVDGSNCKTAGDNLCDTPADPNLFGKVNSGCSYTGTTIDGNGVLYSPNPRNYMSYSRWQCMDEFSQGQFEVMVAAYHQFKSHLYDRNYASNFEVDLREVCVGTPISFEDKSVNAVSYEWTFEGGTPSTSTEVNPIVTYNREGIFDVTLEITEENGEKDTKISSEYIEVKGDIESELGSSIGSFEEPILQEKVLNHDDDNTWEQSPFAFTDGANSVFINCLNYDALGEEDYLIIGTLNTEVEKSFILTFDYAYASSDDIFFEGLAIDYRDPCGEWQTVWYKEGVDLNTAPSQQSAFIPTTDQWKTENVIIELPDENIDVINVAFKSVNGYGNYLWIDNYQLNPYDGIFSIQGFEITNASCEDTNDGSIIVVIDSPGNYEYNINGSDFGDSDEFSGLSSGSYTVTVRNSSGTSITTTVEVQFDNKYPAQPIITASSGALSVNLEEGQTIRWFWEGLEQPEETSSTITDPKAGTYIAEVSNGSCGVMSDPFVVLSVDEIDNQIKIYPNPTIDRLFIETSDQVDLQNIQYIISDVSGKEIMTGTYNQYIDVNPLSNGLYLIQLEYEEQVITNRFIKD